jgi:hypothetical protein
MLTVEDFSERLFRKMLAVRAPARRFSRKRASPRPLPDLVRSPSQGELALDPEENRAVACSRLTDLVRKASSDASLVKVPLRCLRDAILLNATRAGENSREVEALFSLFDGVVALCHSLQSRGAPGPYETVERAVRLRLFLCVTGESWKDHAGLRACALRKLRAFAVEETESFPSPPSAEAAAGGLAATPGRTTVVVAKDAASAPSRLPRTRSTSSQDRSPATTSSFLFRRAPANVHAAIDVSSWRAVYAELLKASPSRMMPVVSALLDTLRAIESFGGTNDSNSGSRIAQTKTITIDRSSTTLELPAKATPKALVGVFEESSSSNTDTKKDDASVSTPAAVPPGWHRFDAPTPGSSSSNEQTSNFAPNALHENFDANKGPIGRDEFDALMKRLRVEDA